MNKSRQALQVITNDIHIFQLLYRRTRRFLGAIKKFKQVMGRGRRPKPNGKKREIERCEKLI